MSTLTSTASLTILYIHTVSALRPPLCLECPAPTKAQLAVIGDRYGGDPVVRRRLMEVRALHEVASSVWCVEAEHDFVAAPAS
jgi:hypothetical protein